MFMKKILKFESFTAEDFEPAQNSCNGCGCYVHECKCGCVDCKSKQKKKQAEKNTNDKEDYTNEN